ncbi:MAG: hypothetical protein ACK2UW_20495 [Anaerolineales bacterium]|jgi:hypothetical protein
MNSPPVPASLKTWFVIHFALDIALAIPLFVFPQAFLGLFNWPLVDPLATRIVAAALFGIGIESWLGRNAAAETFKNMLNLKIIWSGAIVLGILLSILQNTQFMLPIVWLLLAVIFVFNLLWVYYRLRIGRLLAA